MKQTLPNKPYYAIKHLQSGAYLGWYEDSPVASRYGLFCQDVADKRKANMQRPTEWEVVLSPRQEEWD